MTTTSGANTKNQFSQVQAQALAAKAGLLELPPRTTNRSLANQLAALSV